MSAKTLERYEKIFHFFVGMSKFAAKAEPKLNVLIFLWFEPETFLACSYVTLYSISENAINVTRKP